jgi:hypothetical protein
MAERKLFTGRFEVTILFLLFLLLSPALFALIIYEIAKVECKITFLYEECVPDDMDKPEILRVPYLAEGEIIKIIPDKNNLDPYKISNLKDIRINAISFSDPELKEKLKQGVTVIGYLQYHVVEYHQYGYKTSITIEITEIKD